MPFSDEFVNYFVDPLTAWRQMSSHKIFGFIAEDVAYLKVDYSNREDFEKPA